MAAITTIARGLRFPEGPIAMPDGSVVLVEIERQTLSRVHPNGEVSVVATLGGGPNGAAIGPEGRCYVCNNGGFEWHRRGDTVVPGLQGSDYQGGSIQVVDLETGAVETLYTHSDQGPLRGPNDLVFDAHGGFWFTDFGKTRQRDMDRGFCVLRQGGW
jgi:gluconolactonase